MDFSRQSKIFNVFYIKKNKYYYTGSLENDTIIIPLYRANPQKGSHILDKLLEELAELGLTIFWYQNKAESANTELQQRLATFKQSQVGTFLVKHFKSRSVIKKTLLLVFLFFLPSYWKFIIHRLKPKNTVEQAEEFKDFVKKFPYKNIITVSQSAGGIIASRTATHEKNIKKLIAFAYPFKHPDHAPEAYRTEHLEHFNKPFLIIQGRQDAYGGESVEKDYALSPHINFLFTNNDHNYERISDEDYKKISLLTRSFLGLDS